MQCTSQNLTDNRKTIRQSNIELLRIIAMVIIVAHHFSFHGGFEFPTDTITVNRLWVQFIQIGGKIGVNVFVLISGYFLIDAKVIKTNKILKLWIQVFTYSALIFFVFVLSGFQPFSIIELIKHSFPITFLQWGFASTYFVLYLLMPFINKMLSFFDKALYQRFLVLLTICWCIIPTFTGQAFQSNSLLWFIYLYSLAGYIRRHTASTKIKGETYIILSFVITLLTWMSAVFFDVIGTKISVFGQHATYFFNTQRLPILVISVLLLIGFSKLNLGYSRIINVISSATFGVYLIHDNEYIRPFLWKSVFKNASYANSNLLIPYSLFVITVVYVCCALIELARIYILENHYMGLVNTLSLKIDTLKTEFFSKKIFNRL